MRVSYNELLLTSQKVFEGLSYSVGTYEDMAETIAWLELHGLPILGQVLSEIDVLKGPLTQPPIHIEEAADTNSPVVEVQLNDEHLIVCSSFTVEYLTVLAIERSHVSARVAEASDGFLLLPHLAICAQDGIEVGAAWLENRCGDQPLWHDVRFKANSAVPQLTTNHLSRDEQGEVDGNEIFLSLQAPGRPQIGKPLHNAPKSSRQDIRHPRWFQNQAKGNISMGLEVNAGLWQAWTQLAKAVLVEATEESRLKGAGEQSAKVNY